MLRALYSALYALALVFVIPKQYLRRPPHLRRIWLRERLGWIAINPSEKQTVWVHAVSVGEAIAASSFIRAMLARMPEVRVVVSTVTDTGRAVATQRLADVAEMVYMPFDLGLFMRRAIKAVNPSVFIVMETEIWPSAFASMRAAGVPVALINGRISDRSYRRYLRIAPALKRVLAHVSAFCMQDEGYAARIIEMGAPHERVHVTGNFKFDISLAGGAASWTTALYGRTIVAGSTHRGEDALILRACADAAARAGIKVNLVIAPRHPERFEEVAALLRDEGVDFARRSALSGSERIEGRVVLLDTVGELSAVYRACDIAVIGGSFIPHGGQNPLEPAYWGRPSVCGPHMGNFPFIAEFYAQGAAFPASDDTLPDVLYDLIMNAEKARSAGERGRLMLDANRGAVERALSVVEGIMPRKPSR